MDKKKAPSAGATSKKKKAGGLLSRKASGGEGGGEGGRSSVGDLLASPPSSSASPNYASIPSTSTANSKGSRKTFSYDSEDYEDEYYDDDDEDYEDGRLLASRKQLRREREARKTQGSGMLICTWILLFIMILLGIIGVFGYRWYTMQVKHGNNGNSKIFGSGWFGSASSDSDNNNNNDNDNHDDDDSAISDPKIKTASNHQGPTQQRDPIPIDLLNGDTSNQHAGSSISLSHHYKIHYDPSVALQNINPFHFFDTNNNMDSNKYAGVLVPDLLDDFFDHEDQDLLGYLRHPTAYNDTILFCSEGDLYVTKYNAFFNSAINYQDDNDAITSASAMDRVAAMKLTTTIGNVVTPKINPVYPYWVAYTATYAGRRDIYLIDLRGPRKPAMRLTYWDTSYGVSTVVGWTNQGRSLVFTAKSNAVSLPDMRLYQLSLDNMIDHDLSVFEISPVPLSQATDATYINDGSGCLYFVRVEQSSNTIRYVGGTVENLWHVCNDENDDNNNDSTAIPAINQDTYKGTSKSPQIFSFNDDLYIIFMSDRKRATFKGDDNNNEWEPGKMNLWAFAYNANNPGAVTSQDLIQLTDTNCDFEGRTMQEFTIDEATGNIIIRLGADLYHFPMDIVQARLRGYDSVPTNNNFLFHQRYFNRQLKNNNNNNNNKNNNNNNNNKNNNNNNNNNNKNNNNNNNNNKNNNNNNNNNKNNNNQKQTNPPTPSPSSAPSAAPSTVPSTAPSSSPHDSTKPPSFDIENDDADENGSGDGTDSTPATNPPVHFGNVYSNGGFDDDDEYIDENDDYNDDVGKDLDKDDHDADTDADDVANDGADDDANDNFNVNKENDGIDDIYNDGIDNDGENPINNSSGVISPGDIIFEDDNTLNKVKQRVYAPPGHHHSGNSSDLTRIPIIVHSDFSSHHERLLPVEIVKHLNTFDLYDTAHGSVDAITTLRGQLWVSPVISNTDRKSFQGAGMNLPRRQYRVGPGVMAGGMVRILAACHVPNPIEDDISSRRLAVILATDPATKTGEHAFYLVETQPDSTPVFLNIDDLPTPFLGGHVSGGSTSDGGLGSVQPESLRVSPCGRRLVWTDTDARIGVMTLPQYQYMADKPYADYHILPKSNELGQPLMGDEVSFEWSPGGRYLAVNHNAKNQFTIISIVDCGDPAGTDSVVEIEIGRIVQVTPDRFNSFSMYWGKSLMDFDQHEKDVMKAAITGADEPDDAATTLYFLSDRDINTDVASPWGSRQPTPHFDNKCSLYALPFTPTNPTTPTPLGRFRGDGAAEVYVEEILRLQNELKELMKATESDDDRRQLAKLTSTIPLLDAGDVSDKTNFPIASRRITMEDGDDDNADDDSDKPNFPTDMDIDFGPQDLTLARKAYRLVAIPHARYVSIVSQANDDGSFVLAALEDRRFVLKIYSAKGYPSDKFDETATELQITGYGVSTNRDYVYVVAGFSNQIKVIDNTSSGFTSLTGDEVLKKNVVDLSEVSLSVWPSLEYRQMYDDAWRMLRDYFYDPNMTGIDWPLMHARYLPLVSRCTKREELDDVLAQMSSELSALHVFVYGGEYDAPFDGKNDVRRAHEIGSLGVSLRRSPAWKGYEVTSIPERDPDFNLLGGEPIYSPLSHQSLSLSGQNGLKVGDVIVGVNGESVMQVPDIHMMLRGTAGRAVRLDVLRLASGAATRDENDNIISEALIVVPITTNEADDLRYAAWEWQTRQKAMELANNAGFSVGYVHLRDMSGPEAENAFARGFFPEYNKEAFILDVRHNRGGNIDSWVLDVLQRKAWQYFDGRVMNNSNGGLDWDEQFAFRGHIVVLIDEKTSSDGEGVARGISELGLGRLIGRRTWGGGIWLSSDNRLVDGGIASAPEIGVFNEKFGFGMGIEQQGVDPDIEVDNEPKATFYGHDAQLERAIEELRIWLETEPIVVPNPPAKKDMSLSSDECPAPIVSNDNNNDGPES